MIINQTVENHDDQVKGESHVPQLCAGLVAIQSSSHPAVIDRPKRATRDRDNGATKKWLNQGFRDG
jgi:hypothetical protein